MKNVKRIDVITASSFPHRNKNNQMSNRNNLLKLYRFKIWREIRSDIINLWAAFRLEIIKLYRNVPWSHGTTYHRDI